MSEKRRLFGGLAVLATSSLVAAGLLTGIGASAHEGESHPSHIHNGDCTAPGEVIQTLSNVSSAFEVNGTPMAGATPVGQTSAIPVDAGETTVPMAMADILAAPHAIVVHESAEQIQTYIACGDIGGTMMGATDLPVGLGPLNDSGYSGVALLHDNGDGTTEVTVWLTQEGGEATGNAISIADYTYSPSMLEVPVGTTVTWTNNDTTAHTVSQSGGGFESGKLDPGKTFSFTFDTPGTYEFFCQFHANMKGAIVVK